MSTIIKSVGYEICNDEDRLMYAFEGSCKFSLLFPFILQAMVGLLKDEHLFTTTPGQKEHEAFETFVISP